MGSFTFYILAVAVVLSSMVPHAYATTKLSRKIQSSPDDAKKKEEELRVSSSYALQRKILLTPRRHHSCHTNIMLNIIFLALVLTHPLPL
jgi:hypothetical protein